NEKVVLLGNNLWKRRYGGDSSVVGKTILLNNTPYTVVGVMGEKFIFPAGTDMWLPLALPFSWKGTTREAIRQYLPLKNIVKLTPGMDALTAGKRVRALFEPYATAKEPVKVSASEVVRALQETMVKDRRTALLVLMGAAALVLLTACANVTNLLLARAAARRREIEIRAALGASRSRIVQQLLTESALLSLAGGLLGIAFAYSGLQLLTSLMPPQLIDLAPPAIDSRVLGFSLLLAMATGLLFGLWPAFGAARKSVASTASMKRSGGYATTSRDGRTLRSIFVISEMAFALMLLIGAGLMLRSFRELMSTDSGLEIDRVATVELTLPGTRYSTNAELKSFYETLLERLRLVPGVTSAAVISDLPLRGEFGIGLSAEAEGVKPDPNADGLYPQYIRVSPDYFRVMGIRMRAGRSMSEQDDRKQPVAVINQAMADALWPGQSAVGKRFSLGAFPGEVPSYTTVVGVVANVRAQSIDQAPKAQMYFPFSEEPTYFAGVIVRGTGDGPALLAGLRSAVRAVDPTQPIYNLQMLNEAVSKTVAPRRTNTLLIAMFGLLAVVLAAFGVYAVIGYGVTQRTREIGIRIALGASVAGVLRMVLREGVVLGLIGVVIGVGGAWVLSRILESMLYGVSARDPFTFVAAPLLLIGITIIATLIPARAASRVDPVKAIRTE
ncbi:MAG: ABC transporter permease, partial [Gemmatimonadaceae bacterium]